MVISIEYHSHAIAFATLVFCALAPSAHAQTVGANDDAPLVFAAYEWRNDRLTYHFENDSSFNTSELVPHEYEQKYEPSGHWLNAGARYQALGDWMQTTVAFTPGATIDASDIDTFHNPDGDVILSGTNGRADWSAWRFEHLVAGRIGGVTLHAGYGYRRDRHDFLPADIVVVHTNPPSVTRAPTEAREFTTSQVHGLPIKAMLVRQLGHAWRTQAAAEYTPFAWARLTTELPDKYPGRKIRSDAKGFGAGAELRLVRSEGLPLFFGVNVAKGWSYSAANSFTTTNFGVMIGVEVK